MSTGPGSGGNVSGLNYTSRWRDSGRKVVHVCLLAGVVGSCRMNGIVEWGEVGWGGVVTAGARLNWYVVTAI